MGGTKDIWKKSKGNIALDINKSNEDLENHQQIGSTMHNKQRLDDQKLEFFTYSSGLKVGFEKISTGMADKVYHGNGPVIITFLPTPEKNDVDKFNRVYMNIDGEFFHIVKPTKLRVRLNTKICNGSLNFLIRNKEKA